MISFLASIFRRWSYIVGITAPPPGQNERQFVFLWLGMIVIVAVVPTAFFYFILNLAVF
jgi:hypothetical protein